MTLLPELERHQLERVDGHRLAPIPGGRRVSHSAQRQPGGLDEAILTASGAGTGQQLRRTQPAYRGVVNRGFDLVAAGLMLLFAFPLMLLVALLIVLESGGPVFYAADRVCRDGRRMRMLKFRKMPHGSSGPHLTVRDDQRLTRVGAVLARTKLDELPQLINVLRGDMSLVGPRPEHPEFVAARAGDYEEILRIRPGITGLSQLAFAEESKVLSQADPVSDYLERIFPQKCALDRLYLGAGGTRKDVRILAWTLVAVLLRRPVAVNRQSGRMRLRRRPKLAPTSQPPQPPERSSV